MTDPGFTCATAARERGDPVAATAVPATRWLLIEHDGRWDADAFNGSGIDHDVRVALARAVRTTGARLLLVRRPGRRSAAPRERAWAVVHHSPGAEDAWGTWSHDDELLRAVPALEEKPRTASAPKDPVILVCTHGLRDQCCAIRGRPVAEELQRHWPEETWECSHVGGDRFAANVVVLPSSTYYGNVEADEAADVIRNHLDGRVDPRHLRGFGSESPPAQAAVVEAHRRYGPAAPDAFACSTVEQVAADRWRMILRGQGSVPTALEATVTATSRAPALLTCQAREPTSARQYDVERLVET